MERSCRLGALNGTTSNQTAPTRTASTREQSPQGERPEVGRYLLQVDRQTKGWYGTAQAAEAAGLLIKKSYPKVQVSVYDSVDMANKLINVPAALHD